MTATARLGHAVVLGAGTMGSQIAALLAGNGVRVSLLDLDADVARVGLDRAAKLRPSPFYLPSDRRNIRTDGFDHLDEALAGADWVVEAIVEQLEPKRALLARVDEAVAGGERPPIVSTNTSGISINALLDGRSDAFRRRFLGTHFFNPPRYTRLLELIPVEDTDRAMVAALGNIGSRLLGKGTVVARDTPAFIANRLGVHGLMVSLRVAQELGLGPDEVDELTGTLIGRPKSATFRTLDLVGIDVAVAVADHCHADLPDDPHREDFAVGPLLRSLVAKGALGEKTGAGFFRKERGEIWALDFDSGDYRPRRRVQSAVVEMARNEQDLPRRMLALLAARDTAGEFLRRTFSAALAYAAATGPAIADDARSVDDAMRWGFGWELGPFQLLDALGSDARGTLLGEAAVSAPRAYYVDRQRMELRTPAACDRYESGGRGALTFPPPGRGRGRRAPVGHIGLGARASGSHPWAGAAREAQHHRPGDDRDGPARRRPRHGPLRRPGHRDRGTPTSPPAPTWPCCSSRPRRANGTSWTGPSVPSRRRPPPSATPPSRWSSRREGGPWAAARRWCWPRIGRSR